MVLSGRQFLSRREVAAIFGVSPHTVYRWAREGRLPTLMTLGGRRRYPADEIMRLAQTQGYIARAPKRSGGKR